MVLPNSVVTEINDGDAVIDTITQPPHDELVANDQYIDANKTNKVLSADEDNIVIFNAQGNIADSNVKYSEFMKSADDGAYILVVNNNYTVPVDIAGSDVPNGVMLTMRYQIRFEDQDIGFNYARYDYVRVTPKIDGVYFSNLGILDNYGATARTGSSGYQYLRTRSMCINYFIPASFFAEPSQLTFEFSSAHASTPYAMQAFLDWCQYDVVRL